MDHRFLALGFALFTACGGSNATVATPDAGRPDAGADVADLIGSIDGGPVVVSGWDILPPGYLTPGNDPTPTDGGLNSWYTVELTSYLDGCKERGDLHSARDAEIFELRLAQKVLDAGAPHYASPLESGDYQVYDNTAGLDYDAGPAKAAFVRYYKTGPSCEQRDLAAWHARSGVVHFTAPSISGNGVSWLNRAKGDFSVTLGTGDHLNGSFELGACFPYQNRAVSCF